MKLRIQIVLKLTRVVQGCIHSRSLIVIRVDQTSTAENLEYLAKPNTVPTVFPHDYSEPLLSGQSGTQHCPYLRNVCN